MCLIKNKVFYEKVASEALVLNHFHIAFCHPIKLHIWSNSKTAVMCMLKGTFFPLLNKKRSDKNPSSKKKIHHLLISGGGKYSGSSSATWLLTKYIPSKPSVSCSPNVVKSMNRSLVWKPVGQPAEDRSAHGRRGQGVSPLLRTGSQEQGGRDFLSL